MFPVSHDKCLIHFCSIHVNLLSCYIEHTFKICISSHILSIFNGSFKKTVCKCFWRGQFKIVTQKDPKFASSHRHTESTDTYGIISSEKDLKTSWVVPPHQINEKEATKPGRASWDPALPKPPRWVRQCASRRELTHSELLPEEQRVCYPNQKPLLLRPVPKRWVPKISGLKTNGTRVPETQRAVTEKQLLKG